MKTYIATMTSINTAIRAQRALSEAGIFSKIVSIDPKITRRGCSNGIEFASTELDFVKRALLKRGIKGFQILGGNNE